MRRYELTDEQWDKLKYPNKNVRPYKDLRATLNGIIWILKELSLDADLQDVSIDSTIVKVHQKKN